MNACAPARSSHGTAMEDQAEATRLCQGHERTMPRSGNAQTEGSLVRLSANLKSTCRFSPPSSPISCSSSCNPTTPPSLIGSSARCRWVQNSLNCLPIHVLVAIPQAPQDSPHGPCHRDSVPSPSITTYSHLGHPNRQGPDRVPVILDMTQRTTCSYSKYSIAQQQGVSSHTSGRVIVLQ